MKIWERPLSWHAESSPPISVSSSKATRAYALRLFFFFLETERGRKGDLGEPGPKGELGGQGAPGPVIFVDSGDEVLTVKGQKVNDTCAVTFY